MDSMRAQTRVVGGTVKTSWKKMENLIALGTAKVEEKMHRIATDFDSALMAFYQKIHDDLNYQEKKVGGLSDGLAATSRALDKSTDKFAAGAKQWKMIAEDLESHIDPEGDAWGILEQQMHADVARVKGEAMGRLLSELSQAEMAAVASVATHEEAMTKQRVHVQDGANNATQHARGWTIEAKRAIQVLKEKMRSVRTNVKQAEEAPQQVDSQVHQFETAIMSELGAKDTQHATDLARTSRLTKSGLAKVASMRQEVAQGAAGEVKKLENELEVGLEHLPPIQDEVDTDLANLGDAVADRKAELGRWLHGALQRTQQ